MFDTRYKFTAKELDNETSYTYFGARYYDSELSGWLSVDPMSDKYPSLSPYCYSAYNPIKYIDSDGRDIVPTNGAGNIAVTSYLNNFSVKLKIKHLVIISLKLVMILKVVIIPFILP